MMIGKETFRSSVSNAVAELEILKLSKVEKNGFKFIEKVTGKRILVNTYLVH